MTTANQLIAVNSDVLTSDSVFDMMVSKIDASINWVVPGQLHGYLETRYVRRSEQTVVVYLSSQTGCAQACRMCHLTATGQVKLENASVGDLVEQARKVLSWYDENGPNAKVVHFNFMARGEPLDNSQILSNGEELLSRLAEEARARDLFPKFQISTIIPTSFKGQALTDVFPVIHPEIYYSIYNMNPAFRRRWLPRALPAEHGLALLKDWQYLTSKIPKLHYAFIEGENDGEDVVRAICDAVNDLALRVNVNIVRYNPYSEKFGREPSYEVIVRNAEIFKEYLPHARVQIKPRLGFDVNASCGMFVE